MLKRVHRMFWNKKQKRTISVKFFDAATDATIGESELPPEQLPETFAVHTNLDIAGKSYEVVKAVPLTRAEAVTAGKLLLTLSERRVDTVDPRSILFSLPTICDALPAPGDVPAEGKNFCTLLEDDWRQVELVSAQHRHEVETAFEKIRAIHDKHRKGLGFDAMHVRTEAPQPLSGTKLRMSEIYGALGNGTVLDGVAFHRSPNLVPGSFAVELAGVVVYGLQTDNVAEVVAFQLRTKGALPDAVAELARKHSLLFVDWCRARVADPSTESPAKIFG